MNSGIDEIPDLVLRASDAYQPVPWNRLSGAQRQELSSGTAGETFGALRPAGGGLLVPLSRRLARAFMALRDPGPCPFFPFAEEKKRIERRVAELIEEGVIEVVDRGQKSSRQKSSYPLDGFLATLSHQAVLWASQMPRLRQRLLIRRLYDFNRLPLTDAWTHRLPDRGAVIKFLGVDRAPPTEWRHRPRDLSPGWLGLERLEPGRQLPAQVPAGPFKLYISPRPELLPAVLESLWPQLAKLPVTAVKIADSLGGLLRPDKLIVYSPRLEWISSLAQGLLAELDRGAAHGVPFSAEIGGGGLLSWGLDQHRIGAVRSWRAWLITRLAAALKAPIRERSDQPPWHRALMLLRREGIDVERWQPRRQLWLRTI